MYNDSRYISINLISRNVYKIEVPLWRFSFICRNVETNTTRNTSTNLLSTWYTDLLVCLSVCRTWYSLAKLYFYEHVEFNRLSSIDKCLQSVPHQLNLRVKKVTFNCRDIGYMPYPQPRDFVKQFQQLIMLCPNIEVLACSPDLPNMVVSDLYSFDKFLSKPNFISWFGLCPRILAVCAPLPSHTERVHSIGTHQNGIWKI